MVTPKSNPQSDLAASISSRPHFKETKSEEKQQVLSENESVDYEEYEEVDSEFEDAPSTAKIRSSSPSLGDDAKSSEQHEEVAINDGAEKEEKEGSTRAELHPTLSRDGDQTNFEAPGNASATASCAQDGEKEKVIASPISHGERSEKAASVTPDASDPIITRLRNNDSVESAKHPALSADDEERMRRRRERFGTMVPAPAKDVFNSNLCKGIKRYRADNHHADDAASLSPGKRAKSRHGNSTNTTAVHENRSAQKCIASNGNTRVRHKVSPSSSLHYTDRARLAPSEYRSNRSRYIGGPRQERRVDGPRNGGHRGRGHRDQRAFVRSDNERRATERVNEHNNLAQRRNVDRGSGNRNERRLHEGRDNGARKNGRGHKRSHNERDREPVRGRADQELVRTDDEAIRRRAERFGLNAPDSKGVSSSAVDSERRRVKHNRRS